VAVELLYKLIGLRIKTAREDMSLTQEDLGVRVGLTRTSISNIENGRQKIQVDTIYDIARVLNIDPFSLLPPQSKGEAVEKRYLANLKPDVQKWVEAIIISRPERAEGSKSRAKDIQSLTEKPEDVLAQHGFVEPPIPVEKIARMCGAEIRFAPFEGEMAGLLFHEGNDIIIGINSLNPKIHQRFTIAHMLGHLTLNDKSLHVDKDFVGSTTKFGPHIAPEEKAANDFACRLLMPLYVLADEIKGRAVDYQKIDVMTNLADRFKVYLPTLTHRLDMLIEHRV
jgi:transcriptional regulator with XRE-family HTH domain